MHVHISWDIDAGHLDWLTEELGTEVHLSAGKTTPPDTQILVRGRPSEEELDTLNSLEAVIIPFAGLPPETKTLLLERPHIKVYNIHHNASSTAEMAIALMLASCKRIPQYDKTLRQGTWVLDTEYAHSSMYGKKVLVMGYGAIGSKVAQICHAMGMKVSALKNSPPTDQNHSVTFLDHDTWRDHLPDTDIIHLCLPATEKTKNIIGEHELSLLPKHACLVNIGRGSLIDETALFTALNTGKLGCAGIDVWWNYPKSRKDDTCHPSKHPFHELANVVMTPHRAGDLGDASLELRRMQEIATTIQNHISGQKLSNEVDLQQGY